MDPLIVQNLTKIFRSKSKWFSQPDNDSHPNIIIDNISFSLKQGEIVGLSGVNGSGKSTLMHMLIGILTPTSGSIKYFGKDFFENRSSLMQNIAFASSNFKPAGSLTIMQNLKFFTRIYDIPNEIANTKIDNLISIFGLSDYKHKKIADLSAGEANKICILKAFLPDAKIVLFDEPTAFLDIKTAEVFRVLVNEQRNKIGTTFFLTSHNQEDILELCDRILYLDKGNIKNNTN